MLIVRAKEGWKYLLIEGVIFSIIGITALIVPTVFSIGVSFLLGILFLILGIAQFARIGYAKDDPGIAFSIVTALMVTLAGLYLLFYPTAGLLTITLILTILFFLDGILKIYQGIQLRPYSKWGFVVLNGIFELAIALLIWAGWPISALWFIGILVGINFLITGLTLSIVALDARR